MKLLSYKRQICLLFQWTLSCEFQFGVEATSYVLPTDQLGTQLDPAAHWNPNYPSIDELPPTFAVRPLVVIPIQDKVARDPNYSLKVEDILAWEKHPKSREALTLG